MTILHIAGVYQKATEALDKYGDALTAQTDSQTRVMRFGDQLAECEVAVRTRLMADNQGEIPGSNADKRGAAVDAAEQGDDELVRVKDLLAAAQRDACVTGAHVKHTYMTLQVMRAYMSALGALGT